MTREYPLRPETFQNLKTLDSNSAHSFGKMADNVIDSNKQQNAHGIKKSQRKEAYTIDFGNDNKSSLQDSFLKFKKAKQVGTLLCINLAHLKSLQNLLNKILSS